MPKHNIDAIARVAYEAKRAWVMGTSIVHDDPPTTWDDLEAEDQRAVRAEVLEAIHGEPTKDQEGGTEAERRIDRLFAAIVKALTVRL